MGVIFAQFRDPRLLTWVCDAVACFREACNTRWRLVPVDSFDAIGRSRRTRPPQGQTVIAAEASVRAKCWGTLQERLSDLRDLRRQQPEASLVLVVPAGDRHLVAQLGGSQEQLLAAVEEDDPWARAVRLGQVLLNNRRKRLLQALPERVPARFRLALIAETLPLDNSHKGTESRSSLRFRCGCSQEELEKAFAEAGLPPPNECRAAARLVGMIEARSSTEAPLRRIAKRFGFSGPEEADRTCRRLFARDAMGLGADVAVGRLCKWLSGGRDRTALDSGVRVVTPKLAAAPADGTDGARGEGSNTQPPADDIGRAAWHDGLQQRFGTAVYDAAIGCGLAHDEAEDAVQTVFLRVWQNRRTLHGRTLKRKYFSNAGRRAALDLLRARNRKAAHLRSNPLAPLEPAEARDVLTTDRDADRQAVRRCVYALDEPKRTVALLCELEEWKPREVADLLGTTRRSVEGHRQRARRRVRKRLKGSGGVTQPH